MTTDVMRRARNRQGTSCESSSRAQQATTRTMKSAEELRSLPKLVYGVMSRVIRSCTTAKSSMLFCRSRMFRKKSLLISPTGLIVFGGASGGPAREYVVVVFGIVAVGGGGCRTRKAGTMIKSTIVAGGIVARRYGFRQMNVRMASRESVWDGVRQVRRRSRRFWKTKTTPMLLTWPIRMVQSTNERETTYRALNRRKFVVITGRLNPGRCIILEGSAAEVKTSSSAVFPVGMTCCNILRRNALAFHVLHNIFIFGFLMIWKAHLARSRSCREDFGGEALGASLFSPFEENSKS